MIWFFVESGYLGGFRYFGFCWLLILLVVWICALSVLGFALFWILMLGRFGIRVRVLVGLCRLH